MQEIKKREDRNELKRQAFQKQIIESIRNQDIITVKCLERVEQSERMIDHQIVTFRNTIQQEIDDKTKELEMLSETISGKLET